MSKKIHTAEDIRQAFQDFFVSEGHTAVPSAPLIAHGDDTLLFVNSGMVPFKDCFTGQETRPYTRATSCQRSLRVSGKHNDYSQIGTTPRHHTFFEMLGNFSFGDYFKKEAITFAWKFVTEVLELDKSMLWVSVHEEDKEAVTLWQELTDINVERIVKLGDDTNRWAMGDSGPNGYCSEIFHYIGSDPKSQSLEEFMKDDGTYLEIWNLVFMQFNKREDGVVEDLPKPCIDTGMGLERVAAVIQGHRSNYDVDNIRALITKVEEISGVTYGGKSYNLDVAQGDEQYRSDVAMRIIADHARAMSFLIADGAVPSNEGEGYVLRRLIRRAARSGGSLGIDRPFLSEIVAEVERQMVSAYPELKKERKTIQRLVTKEEEQFQETLRTGLKLLDERVQGLTEGASLPGEVAFQLYDTFGFPLDLTEEILADRGLKVDIAGFNREMEKQKDRSRSTKTSVASIDTSSLEALPATTFTGYQEEKLEATLLGVLDLGEGSKEYLCVFDRTPFYAEKGGQVGDTGTICFADQVMNVHDTQILPGGQVTHLVSANGAITLSEYVGKKGELTIDTARRAMIAKHHSGTHILNDALRHVLGDHVKQKGSLVTDERLRFDFSHDESVSGDQLHEIESYINDHILANHQVSTVEIPKEEAISSGAVAAFGEKYGDLVRVVAMGPSKELCGGTHVDRTGDIGVELIVSEGSISSGVRRIEAVCGKAALAHIAETQKTLTSVAERLQSPPSEVLSKVNQISGQVKELKHQLKEKDAVLAKILSEQLVAKADQLGDYALVAESVPLEGREGLLLAADYTLQKMGSGIVALGSVSSAESGMIIIKVSKALSKTIGAQDLLNRVTEKIGFGKGGGKPGMATLVIDGKSDRLALALQALKESVTDYLDNAA